MGLEWRGNFSKIVENRGFFVKLFPKWPVNSETRTKSHKQKKSKKCKTFLCLYIKKSDTLSLSLSVFLNESLLCFFPGIKKTARNNGGCVLIDCSRERKKTRERERETGKAIVNSDSRGTKQRSSSTSSSNRKRERGLLSTATTTTTTATITTKPITLF